MKIKMFTISCLIVMCSYALTLKIKTDSQNNLKFSASNFASENPNKPSIMESIITSKPIGVDSRMVSLIYNSKESYFLKNF